MIRTNNPNVNTSFFWNNVYSNPNRTSNLESDVKIDKRFQTGVANIQGKVILDMACGVGNFARLVKEAYPDAEVWGTDISSHVIEDDQKKHPDIKFVQGYIGSLNLPVDHFDTVYAGEVLEHLEDPNELFFEAHRLLKRGGLLIITTPFKDYINSPEHVWSFDHEDLTKLYNENGFSFPEFINLVPQIIFTKGIKL